MKSSDHKNIENHLLDISITHESPCIKVTWDDKDNNPLLYYSWSVLLATHHYITIPFSVRQVSIPVLLSKGIRRGVV